MVTGLAVRCSHIVPIRSEKGKLDCWPQIQNVKLDADYFYINTVQYTACTVGTVCTQW